MDHESGWAPIGPPWLEQLGYTIERKDAKPIRTGQASTLLAMTGALTLAAVMSAIVHALPIVLAGAAAVALVALLALAGRHRILPRRRHLMPAPDPQLIQRTSTTVTSVTVQRIGQQANPVSLADSPRRRIGGTDGVPGRIVLYREEKP